MENENYQVWEAQQEAENDQYAKCAEDEESEFCQENVAINTGINDRGESCFNVGAEGSVARIREYYPAMIERLSSLCYSACGERMSMGGPYMDGMEEMKEAGITDHRTRMILMELSAFGDDYVGRENCKYVPTLNF